jgi:putative DNA methylase
VTWYPWVLGEGSDGAAAELGAKLASRAEVARELAYRLYTLCECKKRNQGAHSYNGWVQSWPEISRLAAEHVKPAPIRRACSARRCSVERATQRP